MKIKTDGLILKEQNIGEQDKLVTLLTASHGILRAFVRGAKSIKSGKGAATQPLCYSRLVIYRSRDSYIIDSAEMQEMFFPLRSDLESLALSGYFSELVMQLAPEQTDAGDYLKLILNSLYLVAQKKRPPLIVKAAFEMRLLAMSGYMPDLICCIECKCFEANIMYFDVKKGTITCSGCMKSGLSGCVALPPGVLTALRHTIYAQPGKLFSFSLPEASSELLGAAAEKYLLTTLPGSFPALSFYRSFKDFDPSL